MSVVSTHVHKTHTYGYCTEYLATVQQIAWRSRFLENARLFYFLCTFLFCFFFFLFIFFDFNWRRSYSDNNTNRMSLHNNAIAKLNNIIRCWFLPESDIKRLLLFCSMFWRCSNYFAATMNKKSNYSDWNCRSLNSFGQIIAIKPVRPG